MYIEDYVPQLQQKEHHLSALHLHQMTINQDEIRDYITDLHQTNDNPFALPSCCLIFSQTNARAEPFISIQM